ncbi:type VII secretion protein EccE [Mycolicibacterium mengxianglii]|uniref:type VII secretion protein EccE n=1 Tax=Mycolicibacterium mengxianglii TaxID=2736649 RepID=UPI0018EF1540|nr:type VII secretion protein EccE [Mycolicibacterium mengxianglii]
MTAPIRLAVVVGILLTGLLGWWLAGYPGAATGLVLGALLGATRWWRQPLWSWARLWWIRRRPIAWTEPVTVANDRSGGGVRYEGDTAIVAVQVLGKAHTPTFFTGSTATSTDNTLDIAELRALLHQSLGLTLESLSVVSAGSRRRTTGDYPRVYDTLIGTPPYAGQRETWLVARIRSLENADAVQWRISVGTAALAAAQRISATLRGQGIRARVATATDMVEMERRFGASALGVGRQRWRSVRSDSGWLTTYWYRRQHITTEILDQAWAMRADGVMQNVTLFPDGTVTATVTLVTAQPPIAPPAVLLRNLPGEQSAAVAASLCGPTARLRGIRHAPLPQSLTIPVGPSGVLLGKVGAGDRMLLPLGDPGEFTRIHLAAEDALAKRLVIRAAGAGDRITVHTKDLARWSSVRMPDVAVTDRTRPIAGTTVSVVDGTISPAPRPNTIISVGRPGERLRGSADVVITQTGPAMVDVTAAGRVYHVEVELFRAENRYVSHEPVSVMSERELVDDRR